MSDSSASDEMEPSVVETADKVEPIAARLLPSHVTVICPTCEMDQDETIALEEDNFGFWSVGASERFIHCDNCGQFLDAGWNGWRWHDEDSAAPSPWGS